MIDIPAVAIYLLFVFITTEVGKRWLKIPAIYLSWVIGAICYGVLAIANWFRMDSILYYLFLTLALNGVYKGATPLWDYLADSFGWVPKRSKGV